MRRVAWLVVALAAMTSMLTSVATTQAASALLYSWEGGLEGWTAANATLANSTTLGVTDGLQSLLLDNHTSGFKNDAGVATVGSGPAFLAWQQAATRLFAGDTDVKLEFDFSYDHTNATDLPKFGQIGLFLNSTDVGFTQYGTGSLIGGNLGADFPRLEADALGDGVTLTSNGPNSVHIAIPLGVRIGVGGPASTFYQIGFKTNGAWGGTVDWAIDNMIISGANIIDNRIPEPGTLALAAMGAMGLAAARRARRRYARSCSG
jgi:hypothetical protein